MFVVRGAHLCGVSGEGRVPVRRVMRRARTCAACHEKGEYLCGVSRYKRVPVRRVMRRERTSAGCHDKGAYLCGVSSLPSVRSSSSSMISLRLLISSSVVSDSLLTKQGSNYVSLWVILRLTLRNLLTK